MPPRGPASVGWHCDNYFFGTSRSGTISCVCYLRQTSMASGCLRVVPGSHRASAVGPERGHLYEWDPARGSEFIPEQTLLAHEKRFGRAPVDVCVPEGSVILFDANLLHAAYANESAASSERVAFHYIPAELDATGFKGVSFARGDFADRYVAGEGGTMGGAKK